MKRNTVHYTHEMCSLLRMIEFFVIVSQSINKAMHQLRQIQHIQITINT